jgi:cyclic pyranopterin phosphate synthase
MPERGVVPLLHEETLSYEEMERLVGLFGKLGIRKVRITGGEPFARRGCLQFIQRLKNQIGVEQLYLTTNGVETSRYLGSLKEIGISGMNLSLDTLDRNRFKDITRRDRLDRVLITLYQALELNIPLKINTVVSESTSDKEIVNLGELPRKHAISLRFIEMMPFSGAKKILPRPQGKLLDRLNSLFPNLQECQTDIISTARLFSCPEFRGTIGIIEGNTRKFCATCNKVRITPEGRMKTCLYDNGVLNLKSMLRSGASDKMVISAIIRSVNQRHIDGHATERMNDCKNEPSMTKIGG